MAKKKEQKIKILETLEQSREDYIAYQNKMTGNDITDPITFAHILSGIQKDILNIYTLLIEMEKNKK